MCFAWLAGLFEGEGSITKTSHAKTFQIRIKMTDYDVLQKVLDFTNCGTLLPVKVYQPHHKPTWQWSIGKREHIVRLIEGMLPYLGERRAYKFLNVLDFYEDCYL